MRILPGAWRRAVLGLLVLGTAAWSGTVEGASGSVEDRLAIAEQVAQYSYRWDGKDAEGFADLFTEDGVLERRVGDEVVSGSRVVGRAAILEYARESHRGRLAGRQTRHHMSALVFLTLTSDAAVTENMVLITHQTAKDRAPVNNGSGIYRNTWRKTDRGWKIAERVLFSDRVAGP